MGSSAGSQDVVVLMLDSSGVQQWILQTGTSTSDTGMAAVWDPFGSIFVMATALDSLAGGVAIGDKDVVLLKLDATGNQEWVSQLGTRFLAAFQRFIEMMSKRRQLKELSSMWKVWLLHAMGTVECVSSINGSVGHLLSNGYMIYIYIYAYIHLSLLKTKRHGCLSHAISLPYIPLSNEHLQLEKLCTLYAHSPRRQGGVHMHTTFSRNSWQHSGCRVDVSWY